MQQINLYFANHFYLLYLFVFQGHLMADLQTMFSCSPSTGSALLYP